jgi:hypothetical protein
VSAAAVIYTQYFGVFLVVALQLAVLPGILRRRRELGGSNAPVIGYAASMALIAALLLPLVPFALDQFGANEAAGRGFQAPAQAGGDVAGDGDEISAYAAITNLVWALWGYHAGGTMASIGALWPLGLLLVLLLLGRGGSPPSRVVAAAAIVPPALLTLVATQKALLFELRYALPAVPFLVLLAARAIASWPRGRTASIVVAGAATIILLGGLADQQLNGTNPRSYDFEGALADVSSRADSGDVLVYQPTYLNNVVEYYEPGLDARALDTERLPAIRPGRRVYVLGSFLNEPRHESPVREALRRLERRAKLTDRTSRSQVRVWEFSR